MAEIFDINPVTGQLDLVNPPDIDTGDVVGPSGAVDSDLAAFDTTTGKLIKDSGISAASIYVDPTWATQTNWFIDPVSGVDSKTGLTSLTALKTWAELRRRMLLAGGHRAATLVTITLMSSLPDSDTLLIDWPSYCTDPAPLGYYTVLVKGVTTQVRTSTVTGYTQRVPANNMPNIIEDTALTDWTADLGLTGQRIVHFTSGTANGCYGWINKDIGSKQAWISSIFNGTHGGDTSEKAPTVGDTYEILELPFVRNFNIEPGMVSDGWRFSLINIGDDLLNDGALGAAPMIFEQCGMMLFVVNVGSYGYNNCCYKMAIRSYQSNSSFFTGGLICDPYGIGDIGEIEDSSDMVLDQGVLVIGVKLNVIDGGYLRGDDVGVFDSSDYGIWVRDGRARVNTFWGSGNGQTALGIVQGVKVEALYSTCTATGTMGDVYFCGKIFTWAQLATNILTLSENSSSSISLNGDTAGKTYVITDLVKGPTSATDSAVALYDATTGKLLKNSNVTLVGNNNFTGKTNLAGVGNDVNIRGGQGSIAGGSAGVFGGNALAGSNGDGGGVGLNPGSKDGLGTNGRAYIFDPASGKFVLFNTAGLSIDHTFIFPNQDGTFAMTTDIPTVLNDLSDVIIATPAVDQILKYNGIDWINGPESTVNAGSGIDFFPIDTAIITGASNDTSVYTLSKTPDTSGSVTDSRSIAAASSPLPIECYLYNFPLGGSKIDSGMWTFDIYAMTSSATGNNFVLANVFQTKVKTGTVTMTGTGTTRTATSSAGSIFVAGDASTNQGNCSYLQTPGGLFPITGHTSAQIVTITVPVGYLDESTVAFSIWYKLFQVSTSNLVTANSLTNVSVAEPEFTLAATDKLGVIYLGSVSSGTHTISYIHDGNTQYTHFNTPLVTRHNDLAGLQGGSGGEYYHLTAAQATVATQAATAGVNGYLAGGDWTTFNGKQNAGSYAGSGANTDITSLTAITASDLGNADVTLDFTNTHAGKVTNITTDGVITGSNISGSAMNTGDQTLPVKASGSEITTGTDDVKFATAKALADASMTTATNTQTLTKKTYIQRGPATATPSPGDTVTLDLSLGNVFTIQMPAGNITIALNNATTGQYFIINIIQDGGGSRTVTWFSTIKWFTGDGTAPTLTTTGSKTDTTGFGITGTGTYNGYLVGKNG